VCLRFWRGDAFNASLLGLDVFAVLSVYHRPDSSGIAVCVVASGVRWLQQ